MASKLKIERYHAEFAERSRLKAELDRHLRACNRCPGLNIPGTEVVPGFGHLMASTMIVGQSACDKCRLTQMPFTEGCGLLIDRALAIVRRDRHQIFITNASHCHPPKNRPSKEHEIDNCSRFLIQELGMIKPKVMIVLGRQAAKAVKDLGLEIPRCQMFEESVFELDFQFIQDDLQVTFGMHPGYVMRQGMYSDFARKWVKNLAKWLQGPVMVDDF